MSDNHMSASSLLAGETEQITAVCTKGYLLLIRLANTIFFLVAFMLYASAQSDTNAAALIAINMCKLGFNTSIPTIAEHALFWPAVILALAFIFGVVYRHMAKKSCLTITNNRVLGRTPFGKQVDLPIDSISALAKGFCNTICISTSSGSVRFSGITNRDAVYDAVNQLLFSRQKEKDVPFPVHEADSLMKYKELLDSGVITQEEFDAKKKQLLGL